MNTHLLRAYYTLRAYYHYCTENRREVSILFTGLNGTVIGLMERCPNLGSLLCVRGTMHCRQSDRTRARGDIFLGVGPWEDPQLLMVPM